MNGDTRRFINKIVELQTAIDALRTKHGRAVLPRRTADPDFAES